VRFASAPVAIVVMAATVAMVAVAATVATIAMVAVVAMLALVVLVALILVLFAPEVLGRVRSAALEIGTRAGLIQAWIGYGWRTRAGQGQEQPSRHPDDDRSDFHDDLPKRRWVPRWAADYGRHVRFCQRAAQRDSRHYVKPSVSQ